VLLTPGDVDDEDKLVTFAHDSTNIKDKVADGSILLGNLESEKVKEDILAQL
jgi:hypothetical protein